MMFIVGETGDEAIFCSSIAKSVFSLTA